MAGREHRHFVSEDWVDFVNEQLSQGQMQKMQRHLDAGCAKCSKVVDLWQRVRHVARRESQYDAPESAVRHLRNAFVVMAEPRGAKGRFEIPRLVFDSLWQLAAAGVRSAGSTSRQVLYRAGEIVIEMRLEPELYSERVNIAGQVCNTALQGEGLAQVPVAVTSSNGKVAEATTNQFGEFQLGFVPEEGLRISFGPVDDKELSIPLDGTGVTIFQGN